MTGALLLVIGSVHPCLFGITGAIVGGLVMGLGVLVMARN